MRIGWTRRVSVVLTMAIAITASAEKNYGPGVTDAEIKIGQTVPYSGPNSMYGTIGRAQAAYFEMINAKGGVNGRKILLEYPADGRWRPVLE